MSTEADEGLARVVAVRGAHRGVLTKLLRESEEILKKVPIPEESFERLRSLLGLIQSREKKLESLDENVLSQAKIEEIEHEVVESSLITEKIVETKRKLDNVLKKHVLNTGQVLSSALASAHGHGSEQQPSENPVQVNTNSQGQLPTTGGHNDSQPGQSQKLAKARLPKLYLPKFKGDVMKWAPFWDAFESSVDKVEEMSPIDKFNYLNSLLEGEASRAIQGLSLTSANYKIAVDILKGRFGKPQKIIAAHMDELLKLPSIHTNSRVQELRSVLDRLIIHVRGLEVLGVNAEQYGSLLIPIMMSKLPSDIRLNIARKTKEAVWEISDIMKILTAEVEAREASATLKTDNVNDNNNRKPWEKTRFNPKNSTTTGAFLNNSSSRPILCAFCTKPHFSASCEEVRDIGKRKEILMRDRRCFLCLNKGHRAAECVRATSCRKCSKRHHQSICDVNKSVEHEQNSKKPMKQADHKQKIEEDNTSEGNKTNAYITANFMAKSSVVLQTATAYARGKGGTKDEQVRILFDSGSQRSYITKDLKNRLGLKTAKTETLNLNTFGDKMYRKQKCEVVELSLYKFGDKTVNISALTFPTICSTLPNKVDVEKCPSLKSLRLASDPSQDNQSVDILIGSDFYWHLVSGKVVRGEEGLVAIESIFGWILSGAVEEASTSKTANETFTTNLIIEQEVGLCEETDKLQMNLQRFCDTESIGIYSTPEKHCGAESGEFLSHIEREGGKYSVELPWKSNAETLPKHYELCRERLTYLQQRLKKNKDLMRKYDTIIKEQIQTGIVEPVKMERESGQGSSTKIHYLPHHAVVREDKSTTKIRIVFDGSAKSRQEEKSINECLELGPNLVPSLFNIVIRFRSHPIAIVADIEKAFHMISIRPEDRDALRFLWLKNVKDEGPVEIAEYRFCRLMFGLKHSPAILGVVLKHRLSEEDAAIPSHPIGIPVTEDDESFAKIAVNPLNANNSDQVKVLGVTWNYVEDKLHYSVQELIDYAKLLPMTKRSVLKLSARIFDPLGLITPFTINLKMLFQELCLEATAWDAELPMPLRKKWEAMVIQLPSLSDMTVPRNCFAAKSMRSHVELHGFCDASMKAYAAAIYTRVTVGDTVHTSLMCSKSRVAPVKSQTIPRLELLGAVLLARLMDSLIKALPQIVSIDNVYCWIQNQRPWKQYVIHRVEEIRKLTQATSWKHCPGEWNPADLGSRGITASKLKEGEFWWRGPEFLQMENKGWPNLAEGVVQVDEIAQQEHVKNVIDTTHVFVLPRESEIIKATQVDNVMNCESYSSLHRLLRVTSYVLRFIRNLQRRGREQAKRERGALTAEELKISKTSWLRAVQLKEFAKELEGLRTGCSSNYTRQFNLYLDEYEVLRCKGRLEKSSLPLETQNPELLPTKHHFTWLIIKEAHNRVMHSGVKTTLTTIRDNYWIPRGREVVKKYIRRCVVCKRHCGKPFAHLVPPCLPDGRVDDGPPWTTTGVDYAGPLYVKGENNTGETNTKKVYLCLFTCASTRAVHLELVENCSAEQFLLAFRRFTGRRGLPRMLISDNAKNFKTSAKEVQKISRSTSVQDHLADAGVCWEFIVEKAWWGGFWERLIRITKDCIKRSVGQATLTFEELRTLLTEVEAIVNSRPLTYVYDDIDGSSYPLSPSQLIYGRRITATPNGEFYDVISTSESLTRRARHHRRLLQHFTKQWKHEYLTSLRENSRKLKGGKEPHVEVGDLVILKKEGTSRCFWKLARITKLLQGKDGRVRSAEISVMKSDGTKGTTRLRRPLQLLIPTEISSKEITNVAKGYENSQLNPNAVPFNPRRRRDATIIGEIRRREQGT